ncbi:MULTISPECIES: DUF4855 domain-containing protein [Paenibacillus]|uniref:Uncharacterized protein n=1 Tax=Paenibacillus lautus TaxID=1401 RepID=A0A1R1B578_PAELA|nr:DUF4855 domain-containing protein [Paenibacillus lautus]OME94658.1 hypothetical protein BK123_05885 [Paenibacillus lautus]
MSATFDGKEYKKGSSQFIQFFIVEAFENRIKVMQWWLDQARQGWQEANYSYLELVGMYWREFENKRLVYR